MTTHFIIPDVQCKPGVDISHLKWIGEYIVDRRPDVIINLGDFFDLPSLSSYDRGTAAIEGKRVREDIEFARASLELLLKPLRQLQETQRRTKHKIYQPRLVFLLGNHEERLQRYVNHNPELIGYISYDDLGIERLGWEMHDYLKVVDVDGILYSHYFANPMSGRPYTGKASSLLQRIGKSFIMGHRQELDMTTRDLVDGSRQLGIVAGACYLHDEGYKGYQGNKHHRGIVILHDVQNGWGDPMMVSLAYLQRRYG